MITILLLPPVFAFVVFRINTEELKDLGVPVPVQLVFAIGLMAVLYVLGFLLGVLLS